MPMLLPSNPTTMGATKRFALLMAGRDSEYVKKMHGGYYNVFVDAYGDDGEVWDLFMVVDGQFPETEALEGYDGFVISGSSKDAYGNDPWVVRLGGLIRTLDRMRKRVLGVCFGHQMICHALGGKVVKSCKGWDIGVRRVELVKGTPPCRFMGGLKGPPTCFNVLQVHQDEVLDLPSCAELLGFSDRTSVEMFAVEDHMLGIQGHPEYTKDILCSIIDRLTNNNTLQRDFAEELKMKMEEAEPDRLLLEKMCKSFLKGR